MAWTAWTHQPGFNLTLDASGIATPTAAPANQYVLTNERLAPFVEQARQVWSATAGPQQQALLANVEFQIVDLPGDLLGQTIGNTILIDSDAAGIGWFFDATPDDSSEFRLARSGEWTDVRVVRRQDWSISKRSGANWGMSSSQHSDELDVMHELSRWSAANARRRPFRRRRSFSCDAHSARPTSRLSPCRACVLPVLAPQGVFRFDDE
jgi:hypothetical protein